MRDNNCSFCCNDDMSIHMLIGEIAKNAAGEVCKASDEKGVAEGYRALLFNLARKDGITQLELSKLAGLKPPTVSVALQKMENEGLITRGVDKTDLRKSIVHLSEKGRGIVDSVMDVFFRYDEVIAQTLTAEELETLKSLLVKVRTRISEIKEENCKE